MEKRVKKRMKNERQNAPASCDRRIIFWYSFRCRFSSSLDLGGSQLGRVRDNTAFFSLLMGSGSTMPLDTWRGGSSTAGIEGVDDFLLTGAGASLLDCRRFSVCTRALSACLSRASLNSLASAPSSNMASLQFLDLGPSPFTDSSSAATSAAETAIVVVVVVVVVVVAAAVAALALAAEPVAGNDLVLCVTEPVVEAAVDLAESSLAPPLVSRTGEDVVERARENLGDRGTL